MTLDVTVAVAGILALSALYRAVRVQWPLSYFPVGRRLETELARSPMRFLVYRFGPVFIVASAAAGVLANRGHDAMWPLVAIGAGHAALTSGRGVVDAARRVHGPLSRTRIAAHGGIGLACIGVAALAIPLGPTVAPFVPDREELVNALWTAGLAAVAGAWLLSLTRDDTPDDDGRTAAFRSSKAAIGERVWRAATDTAREVHADERLVQAVLLVENIQRPVWIRHLERTVGFVTRSGSFGPLQVRGRAPSGSDLAQVEEGVRQQFAGQRFPWGLGGEEHELAALEKQWRRAFLTGYNGDPQWCLDAQKAYDWLEYGGSTAPLYSPVTAPDGLPTIEVMRIRQSDETIGLSGTLFAPGSRLVSVQLDHVGRELARVAIDIAHDDGHRVRWTVSHDLALEASVLIVRDEPSDNRQAVGPAPQAIAAALRRALGSDRDIEQPESKFVTKASIVVVPLQLAHEAAAG
jgi:hypothetical protein